MIYYRNPPFSMRSLYTRSMFSITEAKKAKANAGCKMCPCCGETKTDFEYIKEGIFNRGVSVGLISKTWVEGIFRMKGMKCDCYKCYSCGAEWESEPYEW